MLCPVIRDGKLLKPEPTLAEICSHAANELARLPKNLCLLDKSVSLFPKISPKLAELVREVDDCLNQAEISDQALWSDTDE